MPVGYIAFDVGGFYIRAWRYPSIRIREEAEELKSPQRTYGPVLFDPTRRPGLHCFVFSAIRVFAEGRGAKHEARLREVLGCKVIESFDVGFEPESGEQLDPMCQFQKLFQQRDG